MQPDLTTCRLQFYYLKHYTNCTHLRNISVKAVDHYYNYYSWPLKTPTSSVYQLTQYNIDCMHIFIAVNAASHSQENLLQVRRWANWLIGCIDFDTRDQRIRQPLIGPNWQRLYLHMYRPLRYVPPFIVHMYRPLRYVQIIVYTSYLT